MYPKTGCLYLLKAGGASRPSAFPEHMRNPERLTEMKKPYTYDFPKPPPAGEASGVLTGLAFILYDCRWSARLSSWNYTGVLSPYWRLLHSTRGTGLVRFAAGTLTLTVDPAHVILIPPDVEADFLSTGELDMLYAHFLPVFPVSLEPVLQFDAPVAISAGAVHRGLGALLTVEPPRPPACDTLLFRALLDICFAELLAPHVGACSRQPPPDPRVMRMLTWMREHYAEPLTNVRIAQSAGLEPGYAAHLFRRVVGNTLHVHLREIRLSQATRLLANETLSIKQIAADCGFANRFHFTRAFVARFGVGPATFRRRHVAVTEPRTLNL